MTDLIERIKAGPGSRELSDKCLLAVGWVFRDNGRDLARWISPRGEVWEPYEQPNPSQNLQDAIDWMVPEDAQWSMDARAEAAIAYVGPTNENEGDALKPALALCAAALRAREAMENDDG